MKPGDVVIGAFPGAQLTKTRPAVVLSTEEYHRNRPDVIVGIITTQAPQPWTPTDCALLDWKQAGLHSPSHFRLYLVTLPHREVRMVGRLSDSDWHSVLSCLHRGLGNVATWQRNVGAGAKCTEVCGLPGTAADWSELCFLPAFPISNWSICGTNIGEVGDAHAMGVGEHN